jgi:large conductance mechanosensitive channel
MLKEFITRGNVAELAVGVIIGAAFGKIVGSFVGDLLMPPIGRLLAKAEVGSLFVNLSGQHYPSVAAAKAAGAPTLNYGAFLPAAPAHTTRPCALCLSQIPQKATRCAHCTSELKPA